jgi:hypothetical protein
LSKKSKFDDFDPLIDVMIDISFHSCRSLVDTVYSLKDQMREMKQVRMQLLSSVLLEYNFQLVDAGTAEITQRLGGREARPQAP